MKIYKQIIIAVLVTTIVACSIKTTNSDNSGNSTPYFKTQSEAVIRGKNDLISILKSTSAFQLNVNPELLQKSQPGISVKHLEVDFDQLLKKDQLNSLNELKNTQKSYVNSLMVDSNVLTVIQTAESSKGWTVTGIADSGLANEIGEIINMQPNLKDGDVTLFEIPNLQAFVYQVKTSDGDSYYTSYNGFSLKERVSIEQLYPLLHSDALVLERTYGDELKSQKLVK